MSKTRAEAANIISVEYWRDRYIAAKKKVKGIGVNKAMALNDSYYDSIDGVNEYITVNRGKASIEKTQRAVLSLEKYLDGLTKPKTVPRHLRKMHLPK